MERTSVSAACTSYGLSPIWLSVDPGCRSKDEADRLRMPLIANLLRVAKGGLEGARLLSPRVNRNAIYLCEPAAERIIRAVLTSGGEQPGIRHELKDMVDFIPDENPVTSTLRAIEHLAAYATS